MQLLVNHVVAEALAGAKDHHIASTHSENAREGRQKHIYVTILYVMVTRAPLPRHVGFGIDPNAPLGYKCQ